MSDTPELLWLQDREGPFRERVYAAVRLVPAGAVTTYGDVGAVLGAPRLARQVGWALNALNERDVAPPVPWWRVINARGSISFRGDLSRGEEQQALLKAEGVGFDAAGRCDLRRLRWRYPTL